MVVGTKIDLASDRQVPTDEGQALSEEMGAMFMEVSAKTGQNVKEVFKLLAEALPGMTEVPYSPPKLEDISLGHRERDKEMLMKSGFCDMFLNPFAWC